MKISHVKSNDWDAIYIDGKLEFEGHSISEEVWRSLIRAAFNAPKGELEIIEADEEALIEVGSYPILLRDVVR